MNHAKPLNRIKILISIFQSNCCCEQ